MVRLAACSLLCLTLVASPAAADDLLSLVPADTAAVWSWRADAGTARLEGRVDQVLDAVVAGNFDAWMLDALDMLGLPYEATREVRAVRNVFASVGGVVPWRELVRGEFVLAESRDVPLFPGNPAPSLLLLSRPDPALLPDIEEGLSAIMGALAGMAVGPLRYDIGHHSALEATAYQLTLRGDHDRPLCTFAVVDDTLVLGMGGAYFSQAAALVGSGVGPRLVDEPRFAEAFDQLPSDGDGMSWLDVSASLDGADELLAMLAEREFHGGFWSPLVGEAVELASAIDVIATTVSVRGDRMLTRTATSFSPDADPGLLAGLSGRSGGELLEYVPADVRALSLRGPVDLAPAWRRGLAGVQAAWGEGDDVIWVVESFQAAMDLWVERDILPWLGAEHVSMTLPNRRMPSARDQSDSVTLFSLDDRAGAASCLRRIDGVLERLIPRIDRQLRRWVSQAELPYEFGIELGHGEGLFRNLRVLRVKAGPIPVPPVTYGLLGDLLVVTSSELALQGCLGVAAGEDDGLWEHPLLSEAMGRDDLTSLSLRPVGDELAEMVAGLAMLDGMLRGMAAGAIQDDPAMRELVDHVSDGRERVTRVIDALAFLGDELTLGSVSDDGLTRFETRIQVLDLDDDAPGVPGGGPQADSVPLAANDR